MIERLSRAAGPATLVVMIALILWSLATRPARLADQPMPATARERVAKTSAQLGRYEAPGAWTDQADAVLDRCQQP